MAPKTYLYPVYENGGMVFIDNFYTQHLLAKKLDLLSDGECGIFGNVQIKNVDAINRPNLKQTLEELEHKNRGEWQLWQAMDQPTILHGSSDAADHWGFVVFKDRDMVIFYTNRVDIMPKNPVSDADEDAIEAFHGLAALLQWLGIESMCHFQLMVPAIIIGYNMFMNGVDRFDQYRTTALTICKQTWVPMSILTLVFFAATIKTMLCLMKISQLDLQ